MKDKAKSRHNVVTRAIAVRRAGADVEGVLKTPNRGRAEAGKGFLSPVRLSEDEAEAIVVGLRLATEEDPTFSETARSALAKIVAASSSTCRARLARTSANAAPPRPIDDWDELVNLIEKAIDEERELRILYSDQSGEDSMRTIRPLAFAESRSGESVAAWCKLRRDFRHFRIDRIGGIVALESFFKGERDELLALYMRQEPQ